ncbi:MAG TPA: hypothetical protein VFO78_09090 [Candidatus Limnocylindrales bacterium]|nr:hypothetical protein [Candidatus Limnocylindrales bacterium]
MASRLVAAGRAALPVAVQALRGTAVGALLVALSVGALMGEGLHTGFRTLDWSVGIAVTGGPVLLLWLALSVPSAAARWVLARLGRARTGQTRAVVDRVRAVLAAVASPFLTLIVAMPLLVWASDPGGPLSMWRYLFYFEIVIVAGGVVGLLVGFGIGLWQARSAGGARSRPPRAAAAALLAALLVVTGIGGWAILPGGGDPIVREDAATLDVVPTLDLPDPSRPGPFAVTTASYGSGLDARRPEYGVDADWTTPTVDASRALEPRPDIGAAYARWFWGFDTSHLPLNALVWYPTDAPGRLPVALVVHGNHDAGDYSDPGYAYLGEHLASRGMVVASVDENFLNGDLFYDYGGKEMGLRGWFLLRHLAQLRTWAATPDHPLAGRLDLDRVALIGHSRGGEAAAVAAMLHANPAYELSGLPEIPRGFGIRAVVGIAPSHGMYLGPGAPVALRDVDYLVLQGAHDGDLPAFSGLQTYHRVSFGEDVDASRLKVALYAERANHGRFSSVWVTGDAGSMLSWLLDRGSMLAPAEQQHLARAVIGAFLARSLQGQTAYDAFFREPRAGRHWLPDEVVASHWESSRRVVLDSFTEGRIDEKRHEAIGFAKVTSGDPPLRDGTSQRDRATRLAWDGEARYELSVDRATAAAIDPGGALVLAMVTAADRADRVDPLLELRAADGRTAALRLSEVVPARPLLPTRLWKLTELGERYLPGEALAYPVERFLQTYEIDLAAFTAAAPGFDPTRITSVAVCFEGEGAVFLDDVGFEPAAGS